jgi:UDP-N-acetylglucosamine 2-epimerase
METNELIVIDSGQHYDYEMSKIFIDELKFPKVMNLDVGSGWHGIQTAKIIEKTEWILMTLKQDLAIVVGDTNTTLGGAIAATKLKIPVAHVEAGCRMWDLNVPEEINRQATDAISTYHFAPSGIAFSNLSRENKDPFFSGDTLLDVLLEQLPKAKRINTLKNMEIDDDYVLATIHRNFNVDEPEILRNIFKGLSNSPYQVILPCHPRTRGKLAFVKVPKNVRIVMPVGYHDMLNLTRRATAVVTDSGGVQREAFWLEVPCFTLRDYTEWTETVQLGANFLVGYKPENIAYYLNHIPLFPKINCHPFGQGDASQKIIAYLETKL